MGLKLENLPRRRDNGKCNKGNIARRDMHVTVGT